MDIIPNTNPTPTGAKAPTATATPKAPTAKPAGPVMDQRKLIASLKAGMVVDARIYGVKPQQYSKYINDLIKSAPFVSSPTAVKLQMAYNKSNAHNLKSMATDIKSMVSQTQTYTKSSAKTTQATNIAVKTLLTQQKTQTNKSVLTAQQMLKETQEENKRKIRSEREMQSTKEDPKANPAYQQGESTNAYLKSILETDQQIAKKKMGGGDDLMGMIMKNLPLLASMGGLLGFLVTGKGEFLTDMLKGLKSGIAKSLMKLGTDIVSNVAKITGKVFGTIGKMGAGIFKAITDNPIFKKLFGGVMKGIGEGVAKVGSVAGKMGGAVSKGFGKIGGKAVGKVAGKMASKFIPGIGMVVGTVAAIERLSKGDTAGAMMEIASGAVSLIPVAGGVVSGAMDVGIMARDIKRNALGENKNERTGIIEGLMKGKPKTGGEIVPLIPPPAPFASKSVIDQSMVEPPSPTVKEKIPPMLPPADLTGAAVKPFSPNVNLKDMNPDTLSRFLAMANEYRLRTGKPVQVNSAKRTFAYQYALWKKDPDHAVPPTGLSSHERGFAIDTQSADATAMDKMGLLKKYNFWRPLVNRAKFPEAWHVQDRAFKYPSPSEKMAALDRLKTMQPPSGVGGEGFPIGGEAQSQTKEMNHILQTRKNIISEESKMASAGKNTGTETVIAEMRSSSKEIVKAIQKMNFTQKQITMINGFTS